MIENSQLRSRSRMHTQLRLCVPRTERRRVLYHYHDTYAHPGIIHLYDQLRERVWWPRMLTSVIDYVRGGTECQANKGGLYVILHNSNGGVDVTLMKNDTETAVNSDRKRLYDYGVMSIEDQHKRDVELAAHELEAVNNGSRDLTVRKKQLLNEQQIAAAGRDVEHQASTDANEVVVRQLYTASDTKHDHLYDYDDEGSWDGVCVTSIDFVLLW